MSTQYTSQYAFILLKYQKFYVMIKHVSKTGTLTQSFKKYCGVLEKTDMTGKHRPKIKVGHQILIPMEKVKSSISYKYREYIYF